MEAGQPKIKLDRQNNAVNEQNMARVPIMAWKIFIVVQY
jgi:hypothetical protein